MDVLQMKAEPSLSGMKEQELKKTVMPFAQMRMKETHQLGPEVFFFSPDGDVCTLEFLHVGYSSCCCIGSHCLQHHDCAHNQLEKHLTNLRPSVKASRT